MLHKKAQIPVLKIILILIVTGIFLISWLIVLNINTEIDEKQINSQLLTKQILSGKCFSDKYGKIEKDKFTTENLENCIGKQQTIQARILLVEKNENSKEIHLDKKTYEENSKKCALNSNYLCQTISYPIILSENSKNQIQKIKIQIISQ